MIKRSLMLLPAMLLAACGADQGSRTAGTEFAFQATPMPSVSAMMPAGSKTFMNDLGDTIVIDRAYIVVSSIGIETDCSGAPIFSVAPVLDMLIPSAHAHAEPTPTDTGAPFVVNVLAMDGDMIDVGNLEPLPADYCGISISLAAADSDAENLPDGAGDPDLVGLSVYVEGTYNGPNPFFVQTGATIPERNMLLSPTVTLGSGNLSETISIQVQYDTWFNGIDPAAIDINQLLVNISASLQRG